jgi:hypothetical protein
MRETGKPTFVVSDYYWRARLRARGSARSRGSGVVSTHGLNTQRMSAVQKVWSSYVYATILLQHGPTAGLHIGLLIVGIDLLLTGKGFGFPVCFEFFKLAFENFALIGVVVLSVAVKLTAESGFSFFFGRLLW